MNNWFIDEHGTHWTRCEIVGTMFGVTTVRLYTGEQCTGKARKGHYGLLVEQDGK